jgi:hypothetical protein
VISPSQNLYLTLQNTHNRQTSMHAVGFEPTISAGERPLGLTIDAFIVTIFVVCFKEI